MSIPSCGGAYDNPNSRMHGCHFFRDGRPASLARCRITRFGDADARMSPTPVLIMNYDRGSNHGMRAVLRMSGIGADLAETVGVGLALLRAGRYSLLVY